MEFDLVIRNGTGRPRFGVDPGLRHGQIAAIADGEPLQGRHLLEAEGLAGATGFIDVDSHADWILPLPDHDEILAPPPPKHSPGAESHLKTPPPPSCRAEPAAGHA
jgi:N-acyl-D-amino-acid deacylase